MRRWMIVAVVLGLAVWLVPANALGNDDVTADGDVTSSSRVLALGDVCPGRSYGGAGNVEIRITKANQNFNNSFQNNADVTISVASVTQAGGGANGNVTAALDGTAPVRITMPSNWNPPLGTPVPFDASYVGKTTGPVTGTVTLGVPGSAAVGSYSATVAFQATGLGHTTNSGTLPPGAPPPTIIDTQVGTNRLLSVTWTVLAAGHVDCNRAPTISSAAFASPHVACPTSGVNATLAVAFDDPDLGIPSSGETHQVSIDWGDGTTQQIVGGATSPLSVGHTYAAAGPPPRDATVTVSDQHEASAQASASTIVDYRVLDGGVRQPINMDGSSVFRAGSTVPVKIRFAACDGSIPSDLAPEVSAVLASSNTPTTAVNESENLASTSAADTGHVMRFSDGQWIYNLATSSLSDPSAKYLLTITVPSTGQTVTVRFGLRT